MRDLEAQARRIGGRAMLHQHPQAAALLEEVPDLIEFPGVVAGAFSAEFLTLPAEVLTTTLIHHQHFFPVVSATGALMPAFLAVTNTQTSNDRAISTNAERVVTARLRDARFFWDADRRVGLEARLERLETVLFHKQLGSYGEKAKRIEALARWLATEVFQAPAETADQAARAARLAKADLATDMVREFTELQGVMGGVYAREAGEPEAVWRAMYHHYLPVAVESAAAPTAPVLGAARVTWACVALADKLDTLVGLFLAGERPTGSRDPFGLRRQAHGILRLLGDAESLAGVAVRVPVETLISKAPRATPCRPTRSSEPTSTSLSPSACSSSSSNAAPTGATSGPCSRPAAAGSPRRSPTCRKTCGRCRKSRSRSSSGSSRRRSSACATSPAMSMRRRLRPSTAATRRARR